MTCIRRFSSAKRSTLIGASLEIVAKHTHGNIGPSRQEVSHMQANLEN